MTYNGFLGQAWHLAAVEVLDPPNSIQIADTQLADTRRVAHVLGRRKAELMFRNAGIETQRRRMSSRTTHSIAHFEAAFVLGGVDGKLPPGDYDVDHDEELVDGMSRLAWRRVATFIHVPARAVKSPTNQLIAIDHAELETALKHDRENAA